MTTVAATGLDEMDDDYCILCRGECMMGDPIVWASGVDCE